MGSAAAQSAVGYSQTVWPFAGQKDSGVTLMSREFLNDGVTAITQGAISSIVCSVRDKDGVEKLDQTLTVASVVFDALQTDAGWNYDSTGYNFKYTVPASAFDTAGFRRVEFIFTPASGEVWHTVFEGPVRSVEGS